MPTQQHYLWDPVTGNYFYFSATAQVFINSWDRNQTLLPDDPVARRLVPYAASNESSASLQQPQPTGRGPSNASAPTGQSSSPGYTHRPRQPTLSYNGSESGQPFQPYRSVAFGSPPPQQGAPAYGASSQISSPGPVAYPLNQSATPYQSIPRTLHSTSGASQGVHRHINASNASERKLDSRYRPRRHDFFNFGRVFLMHWSEPAGRSNATVVTEKSEWVPRPGQGSTPVFSRDPRFGQRIFSKIMWFAVIRQAETFSICIRIATYGYQGIAKNGVNPSDHAIVHHDSEVPNLSAAEDLIARQRPLRTPIRIQPDERGDKLDEMSRLDYGRVYTVEHNINARSFGYVHPNSQREFYYTYIAIHQANPPAFAQTRAQGARDTQSNDQRNWNNNVTQSSEIVAYSASNVRAQQRQQPQRESTESD